MKIVIIGKAQPKSPKRAAAEASTRVGSLPVPIEIIRQSLDPYKRRASTIAHMVGLLAKTSSATRLDVCLLEGLKIYPNPL